MTGGAFHDPEPALAARLYAALHSGNEGDVDFYIRACRGRRSLRVLELGSGALRVALPLARAGHELTGVESNHALHLLAHERLQHAALQGKLHKVELVHQDMLEYRTNEPFDRVLIPYSTFWCLPSLQHKRRCIDVVSSALKPDGQLILDVYSADHLREERKARSKKTVGEPLVDEFELTGHVAIVSEAERYRVFERNFEWPSKKHTRVEYGLQSTVDPNVGWSMVLDHHYLWRHELAQLLEDAGFETEWGTDDEAQGSAFDQQIVVRAVKR